MIEIAFAGTIAENYEKYLRPVLFDSPAKDIINRVPSGTVSILELACGTGIVTEALKEKFPSAKITATDINPDMLKVAQDKMRDSNIEWDIVNAEEIPYTDNSFDVVLCQFGIMFVPDKQKMVNEVYRLLKPGGTFIFNTWDEIKNVPPTYITNEELTKLFKDDPPVFYTIPFSMYNTSELEAYMKNGGFKNISIENIKLEGTSPSADDMATGIIEGNPIYTEICQRDKSLLPRIKKTLSEKFAKAFGGTSLKIPLSLFVTQGIK
jgi:ubiquinone/menaquinone biosynthesis C-methylase UbiE